MNESNNHLEDIQQIFQIMLESMMLIVALRGTAVMKLAILASIHQGKDYCDGLSVYCIKAFQITISQRLAFNGFRGP